jgi:hypothetical protein
VGLVGDSVAVSVVEVSAVEASAVVVVVIDSVAVVESVIKVAAADSEDKHRPMLPLAPAVDVGVVSVVEAGLTVV